MDVGALRDNAAAVVGLVGAGCAVMAMVKAGGYGHGAEVAARAFLDGGASRLGVSSAEEALQLRAAGIDAPVLNVNWTPPERYGAMVRSGVELALWDPRAVPGLAAAARVAGRVVRVHLKVDTGMHRLGVDSEGLTELVAAVDAAGGAVVVAGLFTHFADADAADLGFAEEQNRRLLAAQRRMGRAAEQSLLLHAANSAATLRIAAARHDMVRPGIALYGYPPPHAAGIVALRPALTLRARITQVRTVAAGESVGYGRTWTACRRTRVAVVAAGYADGVRRDQANRGAVLVRGVRCGLLGRVSMDQVSVDVSELDDLEPGEPATVFGPGSLSAAEVAEVSHTIPYEVLCNVSARVPRHAVAGGVPAAGAR
ncbi:MAG: alanine racemase [Candidatus Dormibacteria bacterium]